MTYYTPAVKKAIMKYYYKNQEAIRVNTKQYTRAYRSRLRYYDIDYEIKRLMKISV